jgi:hypothetical protein
MPKKREIESLVFLICQNGVVEWINIVRSTRSVSISCIATCKSDIISRLSGFMIFLGSRIYYFKPIVKLVGGAGFGMQDTVWFSATAIERGLELLDVKIDLRTRLYGSVSWILVVKTKTNKKSILSFLIKYYLFFLTFFDWLILVFKLV